MSNSGKYAQRRSRGAREASLVGVDDAMPSVSPPPPNMRGGAHRADIGGSPSGNGEIPNFTDEHPRKSFADLEREVAALLGPHGPGGR